MSDHDDRYYTVLKFAPGEADVITQLARELGRPSADAVLLAVRQTLAAREHSARDQPRSDGPLRLDPEKHDVFMLVERFRTAFWGDSRADGLSQSRRVEHALAFALAGEQAAMCEGYVEYDSGDVEFHPAHDGLCDGTEPDQPTQEAHDA